MIKFKDFLTELRKPPEIDIFKNSKEVKNLKAVDSRNEKWRKSLPDLFQHYGFSQVGEGKFGSVFINEEYPYALKIFMKDTAYLKFLNFVKQNPDNKYLPKIKGKVLKITPMVMAVRLEKLTPAAGGSKFGNFFKMCLDPEDFLEGYMELDSISKDDKDAVSICNFLVENKKICDIHRGNIMMRGQTPILIDHLYAWFRNGSYAIDPDNLTGLEDLF